MRDLHEDGVHLTCKMQQEDFKVSCECLHKAILTIALVDIVYRGAIQRSFVHTTAM